MPDTTPQFTTASYAQADSVERCAGCKTPLGANYYRVNGALACETCAAKVGGSSPRDSHAAFVRALLYGFGAAILGLILYAGVGIVLNIEFGIVAIAVGYIVARAMKMGSGGVGGRRYQIAAVLFTYFAVSVSAIPIMIYYARQHPRPAVTAQRGPLATPPSADAPAETSANTPPSVSASDASAQPSQPVRRKHNLGYVIALLLGVGLASPFLELYQNGINGILGIAILFFGMRIAWRMMGRSDHSTAVLGPFARNAAASAPALASASSAEQLAPAPATLPSTPPPPLG